VAITGGPARSGHTPHAATLPDQEAQRWAPPLRCTLGFTNQSTSGQHRIRTCDLYGVNALRIASLSAFPLGKHEQNHALAVAKRARRASGQRFKPGNREEIVGSTEVTQPTNRNPPTASAASPLRPFSLARHCHGATGALSAHRPRGAARARSRNTAGQSTLRCPAQREITSAVKRSGQRARRRRNIV
jgi:hypothetical protein